MAYYLADGQERRGPYELGELVARGLKADTLVWTEGMTEWRKAEEIESVAALLGMGRAAGQPAPVEVAWRGGASPGEGAWQGAAPMGGPLAYQSYGAGYALESKRILAGIMGILFGGWGVHRFVLGDVAGGFLRIIVTFATCGIGSIIGLIEGIIYLTKSDAEFVRVYQIEGKRWF